MRFLDIYLMDVGLVPCMEARVSFTGEFVRVIKVSQPLYNPDGSKMRS